MDQHLAFAQRSTSREITSDTVPGPNKRYHWPNNAVCSGRGSVPDSEYLMMAA